MKMKVQMYKHSVSVTGGVLHPDKEKLIMV